MKKIRIIGMIVLLFFMLQTTICAEGYYVSTCIIDDVVTTIYYLSGIPEDVENYTYITMEELNRMVQSESKETVKTFEPNTRSETTSDTTELIEFDITYNITSGENISVNVSYNLYNANTDDESITVIAVLYNDNRMCDFETQVLNVSSQSNQTANIILPIADVNDNYSIKLMAWDSLGNLKPIGCSKRIVDLDNYSREKYLYITSREGNTFNVFMNTTTVRGDNSDAIHTFKYDKTKIIPIDLCGLTYEKELTSGTIDNTDIIIENVDLENGEIQFRFDLKNGRNTGITNFIKFKVLSDITDEQIVYTIQ